MSHDKAKNYYDRVHKHVTCLSKLLHCRMHFYQKCQLLQHFNEMRESATNKRQVLSPMLPSCQFIDKTRDVHNLVCIRLLFLYAVI